MPLSDTKTMFSQDKLPQPLTVVDIDREIF